ncbi:unnamed protein product [Oikopleura dioica]|uniref:Uncharacterized protein n=1 Tax=Oikopleura dioica TaxID=34765 RepID=E4XVW6_OIKDI|nr:unnamed protein product [Oikopleura dioica]
MATEMTASAEAVANPTAMTSEEETKTGPVADASSGHVRSETLLPNARSVSTTMPTASEKRITPREGTRIAALVASAMEVFVARAYITPCLVLISAPTKLRPRDSLAARKQLNAAPILTCVTLR